MPSHRGAEGGLVESPGAPVDVRERQSGPRVRSSWPNSRAERTELADRSGRRSELTELTELAALAPAERRHHGVPAQRATTALATPPDGFSELAALLGLPGQRSAPPSWDGDWSDGMSSAHPSAPVPVPLAPSGRSEAAAPASFAGGWPTTDEIAALEAPLRRRRRAASLPAHGAPAGRVDAAPGPARTPAPAAPVEPVTAVPVARPAAPPAVWSAPSPTADPAPVFGRSPLAPAPPVQPSESVTRRSRRAVQGPVDLQPRSAEPARPGSRRALREQAAASVTGTPSAAFAAPAPAPSSAEAPWAPAPRTQPTRSDTDVLAQLEALLAEPFAPRSVEPFAPSELDLRTDPLLPDVGWTRHRPEDRSRVVPDPSPLAAAAASEAEALLAPAPPRWAPLPDREAAPAATPQTAPWTPPIGITPVVLAPAPVAAAVADALLADDTEPVTTAFAPRRGRGAHRLPRRVRVALPHAAVVGALGVATLVAPLVGTHLRAEADTATGTTVDAGASTVRAAAAASLAGAADVVAGRASEALALSRASDHDAAVQAASGRATAAQAAADAAALQQQQQAAQLQAQQDAADQAAADHQAALQALVGQCSGVRPDTAGTQNGRLDDDQMCDLWSPGHQLRSDAAVAFAELNLAYHDHFGKDIVITDSYRSYAAQVAVRRKKPGLAAVPGTSEHGWGLAVDLGDGVQNSDEHYDWLIENAPKYGWDHPAWARRGGGGPYEPWHWEFVAGE